MNYDEAIKRAAAISQFMKSRTFVDKETGALIKVSKVVAKTKYEGVRGEYDIYVETAAERIENGWYSYADIRYPLFVDRFEEQD